MTVSISHVFCFITKQMIFSGPTRAAYGLMQAAPAVASHQCPQGFRDTHGTDVVCFGRKCLIIYFGYSAVLLLVSGE